MIARILKWFTPVPRPTAPTRDDQCPICWDCFEPSQQLYVTACCHHKFHADCMFRTKGLCPLCRHTIVQAQSPKSPVTSEDVQAMSHRELIEYTQTRINQRAAIQTQIAVQILEIIEIIAGGGLYEVRSREEEEKEDILSEYDNISYMTCEIQDVHKYDVERTAEFAKERLCVKFGEQERRLIADINACVYKHTLDLDTFITALNKCMESVPREVPLDRDQSELIFILMELVRKLQQRRRLNEIRIEQERIEMAQIAAWQNAQLRLREAEYQNALTID